MSGASQCAAMAVRSGRRCGNVGTVEIRPGGWACDHASHRQQVAGAEESPANVPDPPNSAASYSADPPSADDSSAAEISAALDALPPDTSDVAAEIADATAAAPTVGDSLADLEREAARILHGLPPEPEAVDQAVRERGEQAVQRDARRVLSGGGEFTQARVRFYLRLVVDAPLQASGKDPLTKDELDEGAELGAVVLNDLLRGRLEDPRAALVLWAVTVVGSRYFGELSALTLAVVKWVGSMVGGKARRLAPPRPAPDPEPAPAPEPAARPAPEVAGRGWNARI